MQIQSNESRDWIHKGLAIMFVLIGIAIVISVIYPQQTAGVNMMFPYFSGWNWFGGIFGFFVMIWFFSWIFRSWFWPTKYRKYNGDEKSILKVRYAKGEISKKEYDEMMKDLNKY
ncbi:MAG: SHOCT domain-containing protein [Candidatus Micrarchaeales archaeon]